MAVARPTALFLRLLFLPRLQRLTVVQRLTRPFGRLRRNNRKRCTALLWSDYNIRPRRRLSHHVERTMLCGVSRQSSLSFSPQSRLLWRFMFVSPEKRACNVPATLRALFGNNFFFTPSPFIAVALIPQPAQWHKRSLANMKCPKPDCICSTFSAIPFSTFSLYFHFS